MSILGFIPARSGSKRIIGKNIKVLGEHPLLAHTIIASLESQVCSELVVSTDCEAIAHIARKYGATIPYLRPATLSDDAANIVDAVLHTLHWYHEQGKQFTSVLVLQPTSPFRSSQTIRSAVNLHQQSGLSVVSVSPLARPFAWLRSCDENGDLKALSTPCGEESYCQLNGAIYLASCEQLMSQKSFYSEPTKALLMASLEEGIDIDTPFDWTLAEAVEKKRCLDGLTKNG